jgi:hypothetical protein
LKINEENLSANAQIQITNYKLQITDEAKVRITDEAKIRINLFSDEAEIRLRLFSDKAKICLNLCLSVDDFFVLRLCAFPAGSFRASATRL